MLSLQPYYEFAAYTLVPAACKVLRETYHGYLAGADIDIRTKEDETPASFADRAAESVMRDLIKNHYPDHGIIGEEHGAENINADWVWVIDPLDGTKEFLAKKEGCFGNLVALVYQGVPVLGAANDPLKNVIEVSTFLSGDLATEDKVEKSKAGATRIEKAVVACTAPEGMFPEDHQKNVMRFVQFEAKTFVKRMNCFSFTKVASGEVDLAVEAMLSLHDVAGLLPVLGAVGCTVIDFDGQDYLDGRFDLSKAVNEKFNIIAARNEILAHVLLNRFQDKKSGAL